MNGNNFTAEAVRAQFDAWVDELDHGLKTTNHVKAAWIGWKAAFALLEQREAAEPVKREVHMDRMIGTPTYPNAATDPFNKLMSQPADSGRVVDAKAYLDDCVNALDHIARTARNCCVTSKRLTWIASRAESAINSNDAWRDAPVPKNGTSALLRAQARIKELEAALAAQGQGEVIPADAWREAAADILGRSSNLYRMLCEQAKEYASSVTPASPAGVPDGWEIDVDEKSAAIRHRSGAKLVIRLGKGNALLFDLLHLLAAAPSAPEGDGGAA